jgi:hypothetical protein
LAEAVASGIASGGGKPLWISGSERSGKLGRSAERKTKMIARKFGLTAALALGLLTSAFGSSMARAQDYNYGYPDYVPNYYNYPYYNYGPLYNNENGMGYGWAYIHHPENYTYWGYFNQGAPPFMTGNVWGWPYYGNYHYGSFPQWGTSYGGPYYSGNGGGDDYGSWW